jgi:hypothetical protein
MSSAMGRRRLVIAAVAFVEGVAQGWGPWELSAWFEEHLVKPGRYPRTPRMLHQTPVGSVAIDPRAFQGSRETLVRPERLRGVLVAARHEVVLAMQRFLPPESDDGFVHAAIYARRVARTDVDRGTRWAPRVDEGDQLSDVVLALFAADVLTYRESYEELLCVCATCGRVSFEATSSRNTCPEHR